MSTAISGGSAVGDAEYSAFVARVQARFLENVGPTGPLFTTDASGLWDAYLEAIEPADRQYNTCANCRRFFERYGGLVTIDAEGRMLSALWSPTDAPADLRRAIEHVGNIVRRSRVAGVFLSSDAVWGKPETPTKKGVTWNHLAVTPPASLLYKKTTLTAEQVMAEKLQDYQAVGRAFGEFPRALVEQALRILRADDALYGSEKVLGAAEWLATLHADRDRVSGPARDNILWRAIATAPAGFCHPRSSMIGTLLEDLAAGLPFDDVARKFAAKMHPLQYLRPQAAPSAQTIAQAEKIVGDLKAAGALARRFARIEDVEAVWKPAAPKPAAPAGGVFSHLTPKQNPGPAGVDLPPATMTWAKFSTTVLPAANAIEFYARAANDTYASLVTAVDPNAPPILQWDREEKRNPVSWYFWHGGSPPTQFGLQPDSWVKVTAVTLCPAHWGDQPLKHHAEFALFILDGARDTRRPGLALFPGCLRSEFHPVRSVLEAHSHSGKLEGADQASACGIGLQKSSKWNHRFRVTTADGVREYVLDRWD